MSNGKILLNKKRIGIALIILSVFLLFIHFYAPQFITEIKNPLVELIRLKKPTANKQIIFSSVKEGKNFSYTSFDGVKLSAYVKYAQTDTAKGTIILLHGIRSYKEHFAKISNVLAKRGYNSVALDSRAHSNSSGKHCTFGVKEKLDVSELVTFLLKEEKLNPKIGVWGQSLGGAIGLQTMGTDQRIKFGIIESTFTDFRTITNDYFEYHLGYNFPLFTNYLVTRAAEIANFNSNEARPIDYCKTIEQPILLVHGTEDKRIDIKYAKENFKQIKSSEKEFLEIEGANHLTVWKTGGTNYFEKVYTFIAKNTE